MTEIAVPWEVVKVYKFVIFELIVLIDVLLVFILFKLLVT